MRESLYSISVTNIENKEVPLSEFRGKVLLIVNVASRCGFTPQYEGLEKLHKELNTQGFSVLGFPCNQFAKQEPGSEEEIQSFCRLNYEVTFPLFKKVNVNGADAHPLFRFLKREKTGLFGTSAIKWNFTKFLVNREGQVVDRFAPKEKPESLTARIKALL